MKNKKGVGKRFIVLLIVYLMILAPFLDALSDLLPLNLDQLWKKLLAVGVAIFLFVGIFVFVEYLNERRRVE